MKTESNAYCHFQKVYTVMWSCRDSVYSRYNFLNPYTKEIPKAPGLGWAVIYIVSLGIVIMC